MTFKREATIVSSLKMIFTGRQTKRTLRRACFSLVPRALCPSSHFPPPPCSLALLHIPFPVSFSRLSRAARSLCYFLARETAPRFTLKIHRGPGIMQLNVSTRGRTREKGQMEKRANRERGGGRGRKRAAGERRNGEGRVRHGRGNVCFLIDGHGCWDAGDICKGA